MRLFPSLYGWVSERLDVTPLVYLVKKKSVPAHRHSLWYYTGGMTLFFFGVQVATGILLLLYYRPSAEAAYESVQFIMTEVKFGWLIRSLHSWSANLMIGAIFVHMFSAFFMKAYRKPRELTWFSGAFLLFLSLAFGFSGYLLPWNKLAYFATKVGTDIASQVPVLGHSILVFLRGGEEVSGATLTRFFGFHVAILPAAATFLLLLHLLLVQVQGMSVPPALEKNPNAKSIPFFPNFLLRDLLGWLLALLLLVVLASIFPWELGEKADPLAPAPAGIKPEWYFVFMFQTLKLLPAEIWFIPGELAGIAAFTLGGVLLFLVPLLDKNPTGRWGRWISRLGWMVAAYIVAFTILGYLWPAAK
ncbi:MAG: cytochrome bc complex cytochrome b subunit [candidate division Zixibacteria bacterium]|nr:cytochrome bc complex cytochrome b subunit [candidate division Zixibacteria bacterium]